jgi:hypothetical protein
VDTSTAPKTPTAAASVGVNQPKKRLPIKEEKVEYRFFTRRLNVIHEGF